MIAPVLLLRNAAQYTSSAQGGQGGVGVVVLDKVRGTGGGRAGGAGKACLALPASSSSCPTRTNLAPGPDPHKARDTLDGSQERALAERVRVIPDTLGRDGVHPSRSITACGWWKGWSGVHRGCVRMRAPLSARKEQEGPVGGRGSQENLHVATELGTHTVLEATGTPSGSGTGGAGAGWSCRRGRSVVGSRS